MIIVKTYTNKRCKLTSKIHSVNVYHNEKLHERYNQIDCDSVDNLINRLGHKTIEWVNVAKKQDL